jgi:hypothetical protein
VLVVSSPRLRRTVSTYIQCVSRLFEQQLLEFGQIRDALEAKIDREFDTIEEVFDQILAAFDELESGVDNNKRRALAVQLHRQIRFISQGRVGQNGAGQLRFGTCVIHLSIPSPAPFTHTARQDCQHGGGLRPTLLSLFDNKNQSS